MRQHTVTLIQLLLPLGQLFQPLQCLIDFLIPSLLFAPLHGFVLVFEFV